MVCNCVADKITTADNWSKTIIKRNDIVRKCFQKYGILLSPVSRLYTNIQLNENDIDFFSDRVRPALKEAQKIIKRTVI